MYPMAPMAAPQRMSIPTIRNGLLFGAVLGALGLGNTIVQWLTGAYHAIAHTVNGFTSVTVSDTGASALLGCAVFLAVLALTFLAGILTAKATGRVGSGALAGLLAGSFGALVGGVSGLAVIVAFVAPSLQAPADSSMTQGQVQALLIGTSTVGVIVGLLLDGGFGAGMGALGGLIGAHQYRQAHPPIAYAPASYYYSGSPVYPGMPIPPGAVPPAWPPAYPAPGFPPPEQPPRTDSPPQ